jgi:hypothetical protein
LALAASAPLPVKNPGVIAPNPAEPVRAPRAGSRNAEAVPSEGVKSFFVAVPVLSASVRRVAAKSNFGPVESFGAPSAG